MSCLFPSLPFPRLERISTSTSTSTCTCTCTYVSCILVLAHFHPYVRILSYPDSLCSRLSDPPWVLILDSLNWTAISFGFASGADLSLAWQWAAGSGSPSPSHGPGPAFRRYGLSPRSATPGPDGLSLESDAFRCPRRLERLKRPKSMPELTPRTTRTKQALSHAHRSSIVVHRPFIVRSSSVRCSSAGRSRPVSSYLSSIVYLASYAPYAPYGPGCLPTYQPHTRLPLIADIADIATLQSLEHEHEHECPGGLAVSAEHRVIMIRVRRRRAARVGSGSEKARRPGRKEDGWRRRIRDEGEHRVDADASRTSRSGDRLALRVFETRPGVDKRKCVQVTGESSGPVLYGILDAHTCCRARTCVLRGRCACFWSFGAWSLELGGK